VTARTVVREVMAAEVHPEKVGVAAKRAGGSHSRAM
jgi:hypothetical protein